MTCPKCGFRNLDPDLECLACGIVFAKFRAPAPAPIDDLPTGSADPDFVENCESVEGERSSKRAVVSMLIGAAAAYWTLHSPFLYTLSNMIKTLVHEFGHALAGWSFGVPSIPAFDFTYGGGVTIHQEPSSFVLLIIYAGFASLLVLYRRNPISLTLIGFMAAGHALSMITGLDEPITIAMGHGFELLFAGIFFYRSMSGFACVHDAERPLYGFLGFLITFDNLRFAHRLVHSHEHRWLYENAKGGGHWMDFDRLAREFLEVDLSVVAHSFMVASAVPLIFSVTLYCTREAWWPLLAQRIALEKTP